MTIKRVVPIVLLLLPMLRSGLHAQDSAQTVILSERVGSLIDPAERDRFGLFSTVKGFRGAHIQLIRDSALVVVFDIQTEDGVLTREVRPYTLQILSLMAEKVNHFEGLVSGSYAIGTDPCRPTLLSGGAVRVKPAVAPAATALFPAGPRGEPGLSAAGLPLDPVPIGRADVFGLPQVFPQFGLTAGIADNRLDDGGVSALAGQIEEGLRASGYPVNRYVPHLQSSAIYFVGATIVFSPAISVSVEYSASSSGLVDHRGAALTLRYVPSLFDLGIVRFYAEGGVHVSSFNVDFAPRYGARISPVDTLGRYTVLDVVRITGSARASGSVLGGGIEFGHVEGFFPGLAGFVRYYSSRSIPLEAGNAKAYLKTSRLVLGASITFYFE